MGKGGQRTISVLVTDLCYVTPMTRIWDQKRWEYCKYITINSRRFLIRIFFHSDFDLVINCSSKGFNQSNYHNNNLKTLNNGL